MQREDFISSYSASCRQPVCIRLFDPPFARISCPQARHRPNATSGRSVAILPLSDVNRRIEAMTEYNRCLACVGVASWAWTVARNYENAGSPIFEATIESKSRW